MTEGIALIGVLLQAIKTITDTYVSCAGTNGFPCIHVMREQTSTHLLLSGTLECQIEILDVGASMLLLEQL